MNWQLEEFWIRPINVCRGPIHRCAIKAKPVDPLRRAPRYGMEAKLSNNSWISQNEGIEASYEYEYEYELASYYCKRTPSQVIDSTMARFSIRTFAVLLQLVVLLLQSTTTVCAESLNSTLLTWFLSEEGTFFDSKRQHVVLPSHGEDYGVTAREPIAAGDTLARIPWNLVLQSEKSPPKSPDEEDAQFDCGTARKIVKEWIRGKDSRWFSMLRHLEQLAVLNPLPSMFSTKGKELFLDILGGEGSPELLMDNAVHYGLWDWEELCDESPETAPIAMFAKQFSLDNVLIPIKDLYTHRNGKFHNVDMKISPGEPVEIIAKRDIEAGEKLHISLNRCNSCNMDEEDSIDTPGTWILRVSQDPS